MPADNKVSMNVRLSLGLNHVSLVIKHYQVTFLKVAHYRTVLSVCRYLAWGPNLVAYSAQPIYNAIPSWPLHLCWVVSVPGELLCFSCLISLCEVVSVSWKQVIRDFSGRIPSLFFCVEHSLEKLSPAREFVLPFDLQCPIHFLHLFRTPLPATSDFLCTLGNCSDVVTRVCCCLCLLKPFALVILRKLKFYLPVLLFVRLIQ